MSDRKNPSLAAMPGILVVLTLGYLFVMHVGRFGGGRKSIEWSGRGLEADYLEASASLVRAPVNRIRAGLGLEANQVVQRDGELYFSPDIAHVTGRSFMKSGRTNSHVVLKREGREGRAENPIAAILDFDRQLRARGIRLVLMPTPSKAMFVPSGRAPLRNAGFEEFRSEMERHDIPLFDAARHLAEFGKRGNRLFLKTDSHWTPEAMRISSFFLAAFLDRQGLLPDSESEMFRLETKRLTNSGDLAKLLEGGANAKWNETIAVHPVSRHRSRVEDITRWRPNPASALLLLGDSFINVYSLEEMGWGEDGGFAEVLSQSVGYSVDRLARNADGAFASRSALHDEPGKLEGKTVVVWQFAARELSFGDWKVLPWPEEDAGRLDPRLAEGAVELEGTIAQVARVPKLTRTPYRRAVMEVRMVEVKSAEGELPREVVLLGLGVEDRVPTAIRSGRWGKR